MTGEFNQNFRNTNEKYKFSDMGLNHPIVKVNDMSSASNQLSISAESVSFSAGAQGTTGVVAVDKAPVMDSTGALVGASTDTSFSWVTGTVLTTEVAWNYEHTDTVQLAALANGEFAIDYVTGKIRYKKDTAGVADTCNYTTRQTNIETTGSTSTVTPNINIAKIGSESVVGHADSVGVEGIQPLIEAKDFDGSALPNSVTEGQATRVAGTLNGVTYNFLVNEDGSWSPLDSSSQTIKGVEVAPVYTHNVSLLNVEVTNETNATNNRYIDVSGYDKVKLQFNGVAGTDSITLTMESSAQDDGTAASSAAYEDISQYGVSILTASTTAATYVADAMFEIDVKGLKFLKIKTVSAGGSNDGDYNLYIRGGY